MHFIFIIAIKLNSPLMEIIIEETMEIIIEETMEIIIEETMEIIIEETMEIIMEETKERVREIIMLFNIIKLSLVKVKANYYFD